MVESYEVAGLAHFTYLIIHCLFFFKIRSKMNHPHSHAHHHPGLDAAPSALEIALPPPDESPSATQPWTPSNQDTSHILPKIEELLHFRSGGVVSQTRPAEEPEAEHMAEAYPTRPQLEIDTSMAAKDSDGSEIICELDDIVVKFMEPAPETSEDPRLTVKRPPWPTADLSTAH